MGTCGGNPQRQMEKPRLPAGGAWGFRFERNWIRQHALRGAHGGIPQQTETKCRRSGCGDGAYHGRRRRRWLFAHGGRKAAVRHRPPEVGRHSALPWLSCSTHELQGSGECGSGRRPEMGSRILQHAPRLCKRFGHFNCHRKPRRPV